MSVSPSPNTGINNLLSFMGSSGSQVQLIIVVGIFVLIFISVGYIFSKKRRKY